MWQGFCCHATTQGLVKSHRNQAPRAKHSKTLFEMESSTAAGGRGDVCKVVFICVLCGRALNERGRTMITLRRLSGVFT